MRAKPRKVCPRTVGGMRKRKICKTRGRGDEAGKRKRLFPKKLCASEKPERRSERAKTGRKKKLSRAAGRGMVRDGRFCACRAEKGKKKGKKNGKKNGVSRKGDPGNPVRAPRPAKALTTADCNLFYAVVAFGLFRSVCNGFRIGSGPFRNGYGNFSGPGAERSFSPFYWGTERRLFPPAWAELLRNRGIPRRTCRCRG